MNRRRLAILTVLTFAASAATLRAYSAGRVELELVTQERVAVTSQQEWLRRLSQAGIRNLRIRSARPLDKVGIEVRGTEDAPIYVVTGLITSREELILPGGRFGAGDVGRLARWLDELARLGPAGERPAQNAFGLDAQQFELVRGDLAQPVGFSTAGTSRAEIIEKIARQLALPLRMDRRQLDAMREDKVAEELSGVSCGTALAYVLRAPGFCLVPNQGAGGGLEHLAVAARPDLKPWPVGWPPEKPDVDVLPVLLEFLNVNVQNVTASDVLKAVGPRLKVAILPDYNAMARHGVEPDKATVNLPQTRTTYTRLLKRVLFQAGLKHEVRVDEAGKPFLWITTVKPF